MDSNELKEMITSFIDAVKHNFDLYYDHVSNRSKYPPNEYKKNGDPNADQKFGYKVKRDMKIPASGYRNLKITTRITNKEYSVRKRKEDIKKLLTSKKKIKFTDLFQNYNKSYIVVTFLAILELAKEDNIILKQDNNFGSITIEGSA